MTREMIEAAGGLAFPRPADDFAARVLASADRTWGQFAETPIEQRHRGWLHLAAECYAIADAMLAMRSPVSPPPPAAAGA